MKRCCYFIEDNRTKQRWIYWNQGRRFHQSTPYWIGHLIVYNSVEKAKAAIRQMKQKTLPIWSTKEDLIVRKIVYKILDEEQ